MGKDRRFEVRVSLEIREVVDGDQAEFFDASVDYHDVGYDGVVAVEGVLVKMTGDLVGLGVAKADDMGLGDKLGKLLRK